MQMMSSTPGRSQGGSDVALQTEFMQVAVLFVLFPRCTQVEVWMVEKPDCHSSNGYTQIWFGIVMAWQERHGCQIAVQLHMCMRDISKCD